ncbi:MAG: YihY/virulence factor BrkB family protein [Jatrophihabitans sp.]
MVADRHEPSGSSGRLPRIGVPERAQARPSGRTLISRTIRKAWNDRILGLSAETAFWQLLSLPSLFLALLGSLGYFARLIGHDTLNRVETQLLNGFSRAFSDDVVSQLVKPTVTAVLRGGRADIVSVGFILALWAGSSATATFVNTITIAYGMRDLRGAVRSRLLALWLYLGSIVLGAALLPMLVLGPRLLTNAFPESIRDDARTVINASYWPAAVVFLMFGLTTLYHLAPPRRLPWFRGAPGALLAMVIFLGGSAGLRLYIQFVVDHNTSYGRLATPIAALLFFYVLAFGVLLGAELNAAIEETHPAKPPQRVRRREERAWQQLPPPQPPVA